MRVEEEKVRVSRDEAGAASLKQIRRNPPGRHNFDDLVSGCDYEIAKRTAVQSSTKSACPCIPRWLGSGPTPG